MKLSGLTERSKFAARRTCLLPALRAFLWSSSSSIPPPPLVRGDFSGKRCKRESVRVLLYYRKRGTAADTTAKERGEEAAGDRPRTGPIGHPHPARKPMVRLHRQQPDR